ncbi:hypothetical protein ABGB18_48970 [Nonomuraea sp. B12E4]|uniref:hypothetical protein n=1 Tax=Nonomuraea sp. B12E4 TaxID=3153564 RepID=UPI00325E994D
MPPTRLESRVAQAAEAVLEEQGFVDPINVLVGMGWSRTRDRRPLRFSKTGDRGLERAYRTHWVPARR